MKLEEHINQIFASSIEITIAAADSLPSQIALAAERMVACLESGSKILCCGNGGSAGNAQHFASQLINRYEIERPSLPAIALTADGLTLSAIANDYHYNQAFAKQVQALGTEGDILLTISTSGQSDSILQACQAAHDRGMDVIALTGRDGGLLVNHLGPDDIEVRVPADSTARAQETHLLIIHCICDLIDRCLFGELAER